MTKKKKNTLVFSLFTFTFAAAAAATAILHVFSQSSFWKKTKKKKKKIQQEEEDRISELPKEILVHILGFLEMDELLIGTSLVSTKWRNLWKSVSTLKFSHGHGSSSSSSSSVEKYHNFVDHVLRLRDSEASRIQIFNYSCNSKSRACDYLEDLHDFIVSAVVNQGAQEVQVKAHHLLLAESTDNMIIRFNPSIFTSEELRKFTFDLRNLHYLPNLHIQFPRSMCSSSSSCATQLTHLTLSHIRLPEGDDATAQLHLVCPLLETFEMSNCSSEHLKVLDISAPRLNTLYICNNSCMRFGDYDFLGGCRIEIRTPNLTSLHYFGRVYVDCFTENLPRIVNATLDFIKETGMVERTNSFAIKLLKGLTSAEILTLTGFQDTLKHLLTPFTSLKTLCLATSCKISSIYGMVHFLNSCSSVEKLLLFLEVDEFVEVEGDEDLMLPQCRLSYLKLVHIHRLHGHANEIEFVKFLLKSSVVLEDLIIKTTKNSPMKTIEENLKQFIEEEPSFRSIKLCVLQDES